MSHELTTHADGRVEFAYLQSDGTPWHGLGQPMADDASIDDWRIAAGMDWRIQRSIVRFAVDRDPSAPLLQMPEQHVLFRSDNQAPLGVVSNKYQVVQPADVLEFFRDIVKVGGLDLSAAGTIYGGKRFWATAKIGEMALTNKDEVGGYLLLSTSADGSLSTEARRTTVRVVCKNTLAMALSDAPEAVKITHRSVFDSEAVKNFMGLNETAFEAFKHAAETLANRALHETEAADFVAKLFGNGEKVQESAGYKKVLALFSGEGMGAMNDGVFGTRWGLLNAVTEYADHHVRARSDENRFVSAQWGQGANLKRQALDLLLAA
jgi:phage/plasmid-like protein (TIGR03299 family)